jgi:hypothetical protein
MIAELIIVENEHDHRSAMDVINQLSSSNRPGGYPSPSRAIDVGG